MKCLVLTAFLLVACTPGTQQNLNEHGFDPDLWDLDQTGWACAGNQWNIWLYYDDFDITSVNVLLNAPDEIIGLSHMLRLVDTHQYQDKFTDLSRQCAPNDVKYTIYFLERESETIWLYWNENGN